jgi:hypothetical protein
VEIAVYLDSNINFGNFGNFGASFLSFLQFNSLTTEKAQVPNPKIGKMMVHC